MCGEAPSAEQAKTKFWYTFNNYKSKHGARKGKERKPKNILETFSWLLLSGWLFTSWWLGSYSIRAMRDTFATEREKKIFGQQRLQTFYPLGLNEKNEYLY